MSDDYPHLRQEDRAALLAAYDFESKLVRDIWNAAIEAAAKCAELNNNECRVDVLIRKLKK